MVLLTAMAYDIRTFMTMVLIAVVKFVMVLLTAIAYDVRTFVTMVLIAVISGVRFILKNWTMEDTISLAKVSVYVLIGYAALVSVLLLGE